MALSSSLITSARQARRRTAVIVRVLAELLDDDERLAPRFHNSVRGFKATEARDAPLAALKAEARDPLYGPSGDDHEAALEISKSVKAALVEMQRNSAATLPKI